MKGIKCDRCGKFYCVSNETPDLCFAIWGAQPHGAGMFERQFCRKCYEKLKKIIQEKENCQTPNKELD